MNETELLARYRSKDFCRQADHPGMATCRGTRLGMLAAGDTQQTILDGYPWLEPEDIQACLLYARKIVGHERIEPTFAINHA